MNRTNMYIRCGTFSYVAHEITTHTHTHHLSGIVDRRELLMPILSLIFCARFFFFISLLCCYCCFVILHVYDR